MATLGMMPAEQVPEALRRFPGGRTEGESGCGSRRSPAEGRTRALGRARSSWTATRARKWVGTLRLLDVLEGRESAGIRAAIPRGPPELHRDLGERSGITVFAGRGPCRTLATWTP